MPLDWNRVKEIYGCPTKLPTLAGGKFIEVVGVDDEGLSVRHRMWDDTLARSDLERAAELMDLGKLTRQAGAFVEQYRSLVSDRRASTVALVFRDLGYLEGEASFGPSEAGTDSAR